MVIRSVLSITLPMNSFLDTAMQGKYICNLIHIAAQGCLHINLQRQIYTVVKGRRGGLKGALGSCFGHFRCAFSACSPHVPLPTPIWYPCLAHASGFRIVLELRIELSRVEPDIINLRIM